MGTLRLDDIEKLKSKVGEESSASSNPIEVTQDKINEFADVIGDHQWISVDVEPAKGESAFKGPVEIDADERLPGYLHEPHLPRFESRSARNFVKQCIHQGDPLSELISCWFDALLCQRDTKAPARVAGQ